MIFCIFFLKLVFTQRESERIMKIPVMENTSREAVDRLLLQFERKPAGISHQDDQQNPRGGIHSSMRS
jgi:hypothetical protein